MKRKGNRKYKIWRRLRVGSEYYNAYIRNERFYKFPMSDGASVSISALNKMEAIKKAKSYQRWYDKQGFKGKVNISEGKLEKVA